MSLIWEGQIENRMIAETPPPEPTVDESVARMYRLDELLDGLMANLDGALDDLGGIGELIPRDRDALRLLDYVLRAYEAANALSKRAGGR